MNLTTTHVIRQGIVGLYPLGGGQWDLWPRVYNKVTHFDVRRLNARGCFCDERVIQLVEDYGGFRRSPGHHIVHLSEVMCSNKVEPLTVSAGPDRCGTNYRGGADDPPGPPDQHWEDDPTDSSFSVTEEFAPSWTESDRASASAFGGQLNTANWSSQTRPQTTPGENWEAAAAATAVGSGSRVVGGFADGGAGFADGGGEFTMGAYRAGCVEEDLLLFEQLGCEKYFAEGGGGSGAAAGNVMVEICCEEVRTQVMIRVNILHS
eukprot:1194685-Prorocentrum_minimum.AAC.2